MFEQSLLIDQGNRKPWNFLASLSAELLVISLALLIPLLYRNHLPEFHWRDITVGPAPAAPPPMQQAKTHPSNTTSTTPSPAPHRQFRWDLTNSPIAPASTATDPIADAPPAVASGDGLGGSNNMFGRFIPNIVAPPPAQPAPAVQKAPSEPLRVTSDLQMAKLLRKVIPEYPPIARSARISGVVRLIGAIGKDGTIQNLQVVSGHPLLARAALEAVRQWIYKPTVLNGIPVEVIAPIEVSFTLGQ